MYNNFNQGKEVKLFYDQFRTPLSLFDASRIIANLCSKDIQGEVINFGGLERVSRLEFGEMFCKIAKFDNNLIIKTSMNDIPDFPAVEDVSMNTDKLQSLGIKQQNIEESIKEILNNKK
jgi:dTDP-4-dehydrorhamnose reductase